MIPQLNEQKKKTIIAFIKANHEHHLSQFPYYKYPVDLLDEWKRAFSSPSHIDHHLLRSVISWAVGKWRQQLSYQCKKHQITIIKNWNVFVEQYEANPSQIFAFWQDKLGKEPSATDIILFLIHLLCPDQWELVDTRRLRAMKDLLGSNDQADHSSSSEYPFSDFEQYTLFYQQLLPKVQPILGDQARVKLDRFLFAYGYREMLAKVVETTGVIREPFITSLDWATVKCKHYKLELITERANADILFACLLLALDQEKEVPRTFTLGDFMNYIPLGTGGICNPGSYHYAVIAMFGKQKNRDYIQFDDPLTTHAFTDEANKASRDMRFYKQYVDHAVRIHPKYCLK